ncbi:Ig-like domain-containing protein [Bifidobacterium sp. LC6]|uniref:Ig-like domain-containing protein n=1 Tax=Bifidobacterium colobi TaxID=2809026 RepID=A0ABS5UVE9_9BIFI|nr:Ig-like domain-containing protein [Bifidobacterium colobi]MBT1174604.1 Ig-like domain-containing protein [Bifidobacterium colobi]
MSIASSQLQTQPQRQESQHPGRRIIDFDADWRFFRGSPTGAEKPAFDDSDWRQVTVPHDFGVEGRFSRNARATVGYLKVGEGWYRKTFLVPEDFAGKHITLDFDGVMNRSEIWLNGEKVGEHHYGYTAFSLDLTGKLKIGKENIITVRAVNEEPSSRWYAGAGLYRDIVLTVTDPVHVARFGTQITTPTLEQDVKTNGPARVDVKTSIVNDSGERRAVTVRTTIRNADGAAVAETESEISIGPDNTGETIVEQRLDVADPHLWSTSDPYQYLAETVLLVNGAIVDTYETRFGLRWITLDPKHGLFLNGVNMRALGMCMHHDQGALGAATYRRAVTRQLEIMKEGGVNAIRTSHNPACKIQIEECSRLGLLVLEELTDMWTAPKNRNDYSNYFAHDYPEDLKSMILRDRNEPSVFMWGMGNEIAWQESELPIAEDLTRLCHLYDPTRPNSVNDASYLSKGIDGIGNEIHKRMDTRGYSYIGKGKMLEVHEKNPNDVIVNSESANICSNRGYYVYPTEVSECPAVLPPIDANKYPFEPGRQPWDDTTYELSAYNIRGKRGNYIDVAFERLIHIPFNVGEFGWTGFDYIGEPAPYISNSYWNKPEMSESDGTVLAPLRSYYGMVDTAGFPKDQWYLYKALWTDPQDAPMIHLLPHWNWSVGEGVSVWAYTNAVKAELFLNGRSLGVKEFDSFNTDFHLDPAHADKPFQYRYAKENPTRRKLSLDWEVPFEPGTLLAIAYDANGNEVARDTVSTPGSPAGIRLDADRHVIDGDGKDLAYITAAIVDDADIVVPRADNEVTFSVENGRLLGTDNGSQTNTEPLQSATHRAYSGLVLAIVASDGSGKPIRVTARSRGLEKGTCTLAVSGTVQATDVVDVEPVHVRTLCGNRPALPETVVVRFGDGSKRSVPVAWSETDDAAYRTSNRYVVSGDAEGTPVSAEVSVVRLVDLVDVKLAVKNGQQAKLPDTVTAIAEDGAMMSLPVAWQGGGTNEDGIRTLNGTVTGSDLVAKATVRIMAEQEDAANEPALVDLRIDGATIDGFDPEHTEYTLARSFDDPKPIVTADAGRNTAYVLPPANWPDGAYTVHVTSEDGKRGRTYTIALDVSHAPVDRVELAVSETKLAEDTTAALTVKAFDSNGRAIDSDYAQIDVASADESVAAVEGSTIKASLSGTTELTASVTYAGATAVSAPLTLTVVPGAQPKHPTDVREVARRVVAGESLELPQQVVVSFDHGFDAVMPVAWSPLPQGALNTPGHFDVTGTVSRAGLTATAHVTVVAVAAVATVSTATITHTSPNLEETDETVAVYWSDGLKEELPVVWDQIDPAQYAQEGEFTVEGTVQGISRKAVAHVRVTDKYVQNRDLFSFRNDVYPQVSASYVNPDPKAQEDLADLMDGTVSYTARKGYNLKNRWSTDGDKADSAWLEYRFGYGEETAFMLNSFTVYYCLDGEGVTLPENVDVEYLDDTGTWHPVRDLAVAHHPVEQRNDAAWAYATVGDKPGTDLVSHGDETTYSFEMVRTSRIRITFHPDEGAVVAITEVRGDARIAQAESEATLADITVNGRSVGFDPATQHYDVAAAPDATIEAVSADDNAAVTVVPPASGSADTQIIVVSEDRVTTRVYTVALHAAENGGNDINQA